LLSSLLYAFLRHDTLPPELLIGRLAEIGLPVELSVALPPPEDRSFADVWSALGGELKPSLDIVVSAPTDTGQRREVGPPVQEPVEVTLGGTRGWPPRERRQQHRAPSSTGAAETAAAPSEDRPGAVMRRRRGARGG
jgi:hypothetical protein